MKEKSNKVPYIKIYIENNKYLVIDGAINSKIEVTIDCHDELIVNVDGRSISFIAAQDANTPQTISTRVGLPVIWAVSEKPIAPDDSNYRQGYVTHNPPRLVQDYSKVVYTPCGKGLKELSRLYDKNQTDVGVIERVDEDQLVRGNSYAVYLYTDNHVVRIFNCNDGYSRVLFNYKSEPEAYKMIKNMIVETLKDRYSISIPVEDYPIMYDMIMEMDYILKE